MSKWASKPVTLPAIEFDGDNVVLTVNRLKTSDMAQLVGRDANLNTVEGKIAVCQLGVEFLPKYVVSVAGLTDADGADISKDDFFAALDEFYFAPLIASVFLHLLGESSVKANEKN